MRIVNALFAAVLACGATAFAGPLWAAPCANPNALGVSRTLVVDPTEHLRLGTMQYRETLPLNDHEVVLTFDDGPLPPYTGRILDILAAECVKATYFLVGRMATAYPKWVERIEAAGHTIGTHSQNHPLSFNRMKLERAEREINGGIAAVKAALGGRDPAPFFRIPGLLRVKQVEDYLASQKIMTWSADFPADDWKRINDKEIIRRALSRLEAHGRGILLLHDIHEATVLALPTLLQELRARGYHIVHVVPSGPDLPKTATLPEQWRMRPAHEPAQPQPLTVSATPGTAPPTAVVAPTGAVPSASAAAPAVMTPAAPPVSAPAVMTPAAPPPPSPVVPTPRAAPERGVFRAPPPAPAQREVKRHTEWQHHAALDSPSRHQLAPRPPLQLVPPQPVPQTTAPQSHSLWSRLLGKLGLELP